MEAVQRRAIVGAIGGEGQFEPSVSFGRAVVQYGWILLTGGHAAPQNKAQVKGEVKLGAMLGASEEHSGIPRLIGILPSNSLNWDYVPDSRRLFLHTGLPHYVRNVINGRTPDGIVAFGGSRGTLAEIAFAKANNKPVVFAKNSLRQLRLKLEEHFGDQRERAENVKTFFEEPLKVYPSAAGEARNGNSLFASLEAILFHAREEIDAAAALQARFDELSISNEQTGFHGLPGKEDARRRFEIIVREISR